MEINSHLIHYDSNRWHQKKRSAGSCSKTLCKVTWSVAALEITLRPSQPRGCPRATDLVPADADHIGLFSVFFKRSSVHRRIRQARSTVILDREWPILAILSCRATVNANQINRTPRHTADTLASPPYTRHRLYTRWAIRHSRTYRSLLFQVVNIKLI